DPVHGRAGRPIEPGTAVRAGGAAGRGRTRQGGDHCTGGDSANRAVRAVGHTDVARAVYDDPLRLPKARGSACAVGTAKATSSSGEGSDDTGGRNLANGIIERNSDAEIS